MAEATDDRLRLLVERVERIDEEIAGLRADRKDVLAEAKAVGYDTSIIRTVLARRKMHPADRAEADSLVEIYEAALGSGDVAIPDARPDLEALARTMLAEQLEAIEDPAQADALLEHVIVLLDIRAEIAALRKQETARKKLAKGEGFIVPALTKVVRWLEKCAKHGGDAMRAGEATFQLYRGTVESRGADPRGSLGAVSNDPKLQDTFGGGGRTPAQRKTLDATLAWLETGMGD